MGQIDYDQIYYLQGIVNQHSASISSAQSRITSIDEKLERLRTAKKSVGEIQQKCSQYQVSHHAPKYSARMARQTKG